MVQLINIVMLMLQMIVSKRYTFEKNAMTSFIWVSIILFTTTNQRSSWCNNRWGVSPTPLPRQPHADSYHGFLMVVRLPVARKDLPSPAHHHPLKVGHFLWIPTACQCGKESQHSHTCRAVLGHGLHIYWLRSRGLETWQTKINLKT